MTEDLRAALAGVQVVMMCGVSGAGKTFVASRLEKEGFERLSADRRVWDEYGDAYLSLPAARQQEVYIEAIDAVVASIPDMLRDGRRVVIDASMCKRRRRDEVRRLCRDQGVECIILYLDAPRDVLSMRLARRKGLGCDDQRVTEEQLDRFLRNFEPPESDEHFIQMKNNIATDKA